MNKKFFAALVIMMGFTMGAMAQQNANAVIAGKANVAAQVAVAKVTDLDFKNVTPGVDKTINFVSVVTAGIATGFESTGQWTITKGANTQVTLAFTTLPTTLAGPSAATLPIAYTAQLSKAATVAHPISTPIEGNTVSVANSSTTQPYYATDAFQLDLGGTVSPGAAQTSGAYTADITLTATYN
jgi:hypothetical protein